MEVSALSDLTIMPYFEDASVLYGALLSVFAIIGIVYLCYYIFIHPFSCYPGPFLAKFSDIVRDQHVLSIVLALNSRGLRRLNSGLKFQVEANFI